MKSVSAGVYASGQTAGWKIDAGAAWSHLSIDARRDIWVPQVQGRVSSDYSGQKVQAFARVSKDVQVNAATVTPYVDVGQTWLRTQGVTERGTAAALQVQSQRDSLTTATLGVRFKQPIGETMTLHADAGWQRSFGARQCETTNRFANTDARFKVKGVSLDQNSALVGAGVQATLGKNATVNVGYQGQFGSNQRAHAGKVQVRVRF